MSWHGHLTLDYRRDGDRTTAHDRHDGPLRVLQRLYPEGPQVCHHVLVHPPGGIVGGDELTVQATVGEGSHALITTPGATRFYKSGGRAAHQRVTAQVAPGARLEWLPLETIAYRGCMAHNALQFDIAPGGEMMGWDVLALGLPAAGEHFDDPAAPHAYYTQSIDIPGVWLERGTVSARDATLLNSPLGWAGQRVMGTLWLAAGQALAAPRRDALLDAARACIEASGPGVHQIKAGASAPHEPVVVVRVLGGRVEPLMHLLADIWARWRMLAWDLAACPPRVWRT